MIFRQTFDKLKEWLQYPDDDQTAQRRLWPLIVPAYYFKDDIFPSPHEILPCGEFALTAVIPGDEQTMVYLTKDRAAVWAEKGLDWKQIALRNLREATGDSPFTHQHLGRYGRMSPGS